MAPVAEGLRPRPLGASVLQPQDAIAQGPRAIGEDHGGNGECEGGTAQGRGQGGEEEARAAKQRGQCTAANDPPGGFHRGREIAVTGDPEADVVSKSPVIIEGPQGGELSVVTEAAQEQGLKTGKIRCGGPAGDRGTAARCESACQFTEEGWFVPHVREGFDGNGGLEGVICVVIGQPVTQANLSGAPVRSRPGMRDLNLVGRKGEAGEVRPRVFCDPPGAGAIPAADIDDEFLGPEIEGSGREFEEPRGGVCHRAVIVAVPNSVMQVLAPELPVKKTELVIVAGDVCWFGG